MNTEVNTENRTPDSLKAWEVVDPKRSGIRLALDRTGRINKHHGRWCLFNTFNRRKFHAGEDSRSFEAAQLLLVPAQSEFFGLRGFRFTIPDLPVPANREAIWGAGTGSTPCGVYNSFFRLETRDVAVYEQDIGGVTLVEEGV